AYLEMLDGSGLPWAVAVLGGDVIESGMARLALERGGHLRVGLEDYAGRRTPSNEELGAEAVALCRATGPPIAGPAGAAGPRGGGGGAARRPGLRRSTMEQTGRIYSCDDHLDIWALPPRLWEERLPRELRDRGPKVVSSSVGDWWMADGGTPLGPSGNRMMGDYSAITRAGIADPDGLRASDPVRRLED